MTSFLHGPLDKFVLSLVCLGSVGCSAPIAALLGTFDEVGVIALRPSRWRASVQALAGNGILVIYPSSIIVISSRVLYLDRAAPVRLAHLIFALLVDSIISCVLPSPAVTVLAAPLALLPVPWT